MPEKRKARRRGQVIPLGGGKFQIRVPTGRDGTGRRTYHTETLYDTTPTDAEKRVTKLLAQIDGGTFLSPSRSTVKDFFEKEWLAQKGREGLRPMTMRAYESCVKYFILPTHGELRLCDLKPRDTQNLYNGWQDRGLRRNSMEFGKLVWRMGLRQAVAWGYLKASPAEGIKLPASRTPAFEARSLTTAEAERFISACVEEPRFAVFLFNFLTGLRPEEMAGIRRADIELVREPEGEGWRERGVARVRQVAQKITGRGWLMLPPKTRAGVRDVHFPALVYQLLTDYWALRDRQLAALGVKTDLAFPSEKGLPVGRTTYAKSLRAFLERAEISGRVTPYTLRYSFATLALLAGELDKTVSEQMGHVRVNFTKEVYQKVLPEMRARLADRLESLLLTGARTELAQSEDRKVM